MTIMMVRNVPHRYTLEMLLEEWPNKGQYDVLHLPCNAQQNRNAGYAFINFTSEAAAIDFSDSWKAKRLTHFAKSKNPLRITYSQTQGRDNYLKLLHGRSTQASQLAIFSGSSKRINMEEALAQMKA
jgi:hypothetical protein